jgi:hypothetical protein
MLSIMIGIPCPGTSYDVSVFLKEMLISKTAHAKAAQILSKYKNITDAAADPQQQSIRQLLKAQVKAQKAGEQKNMNHKDEH